MPLPSPSSGESRANFMKRCIPEASKESDSNEQAVAICATQFEGKKVNKQIRVNVSTRVNNAKIRREKRDGRDVIVVPSATLPDNVVMNGGLYPAEEIEASFNTLEGTPAPFGHPKINGQYVSAREMRAINAFHVGAYNENVRRENGRVLVDKVIDVKVANGSENGQALLDAINKGDPIHTSTGLLLEREDVDSNDGFDWIARNMIFDHDAILLNEPGAATPEDGVGMMVNSDGEEIEVQEAHVSPEDFDDDMITMMAWELVEQVERKEERKRKAGIVESVKDKIVSAIKSVLSSEGEGADGLAVNSDHEEDVMSEIKREEFDALVSKVDTLVSNAEKAPSVSDQITEALKPVTDQLQANAEAEKAKAKAEHEAAVNKVVEAEILEKEVAESMDTVALNALADKFGKPGTAYGVNGKFGGPSDPDALSTDLPE